LKSSTTSQLQTTAKPDDVAPEAKQWALEEALEDLPTLMFLLGSRYCDTQKLSDQAWQMFGNIGGGWQRVQAICNYVRDRIEFGYHHARNDRTAKDMRSGSASVGTSLI
jgi:transglutaminase-like putative cysteine protease